MPILEAYQIRGDSVRTHIACDVCGRTTWRESGLLDLNFTEPTPGYFLCQACRPDIGQRIHDAIRVTLQRLGLDVANRVHDRSVVLAALRACIVAHGNGSLEDHTSVSVMEGRFRITVMVTNDMHPEVTPVHGFHEGLQEQINLAHADPDYEVLRDALAIPRDPSETEHEANERRRLTFRHARERARVASLPRVSQDPAQLGPDQPVAEPSLKRTFWDALVDFGDLF